MMNMIKVFKNKSGLSLIEVLAVTVILSIVFLSIYAILNSSMKQQTDQTKEAEQIQNGAFLLKQITKDMRKSVNIEIDPTNVNAFYLINQENKRQYKYEYKQDKLELYRNDMLHVSQDVVIGNKVEDFSITIDPIDSTKVTINFKMNGESFGTTIHFRKGG